MRNVVINCDFPKSNVAELQEKYPGLRFTLCPPGEGCAPHLAEAEILVTFLQCSRRVLDAAPKLRWIQALSAGVDFMPLEEITKREILLTNGRGIHKIHMAEYTLAAMINLARGFHRMMRNQIERRWDRTVEQLEIYGKTLGILGLGAIGREIARRAEVFGMRVIGTRRNPEPVPHVAAVYGPQEMERIFAECDYIVNLLPYTKETHQLIDKRFFGHMQASACFIHIGRGGTVHEADLVEALKNQTFRAMVSDVFHDEPLPENSPLWDLENVILTPHICGASPRYNERAMEIIDHNLGVYVNGRGEMINRVDLTAGY